MANKPILCVDFDGVIHSYEKGWQDGAIYGTATAGFFPWLAKAKEHFRITVYSSRSKTPEGIEKMRRWLENQECEWLLNTSAGANANLAGNVGCIEFAHEKPPAFLTIDDRAVTFSGSWEALDPETMSHFKPWNQGTLGATGQFPQGKLSDDDEGELKLAVAFDPVDGIVKLAFGKPIAWIGLPPAEAVQLAKMLMAKAGAA